MTSSAAITPMTAVAAITDLIKSAAETAVAAVL